MNGKQKLWKTAGRIFLFLCILWLVFHIHYREIYENICNANMGTVVLISWYGPFLSDHLGCGVVCVDEEKEPANYNPECG